MLNEIKVLQANFHCTLYVTRATVSLLKRPSIPDMTDLGEQTPYRLIKDLLLKVDGDRLLEIEAGSPVSLPIGLTPVL